MNDSNPPAKVASNAVLGPVVTERDRLRAAQAEAVMPLIGPLLDAWECSSQACREELPELDKQLRRINRAMEDAVAWAQRLEGERAVLVRLLMQCDGVLSTLEGESTDEQERLDALRRAIMAAQEQP